MIQQLIWSRINRQISSYVVKRFPPTGKQFTFEGRCSSQEYEYWSSKIKITPTDFQTASVVSWENKGRLSQWVRNQAEVEKTATGANFSHQELEDYITFAGETSQSKPSGLVVFSVKDK